MTRSLRPVPDSPPRAVIYCRVSKVGDRGEDLTSPELQERAARDYCTRRGYVPVMVLVDVDRTGTSWSRRQVEQAVQMIEHGDADVIVTWRWSRFARNLRDYVVQTARIEAAGGRVEAALEETDPATAAGLMQRDLFAVLAQWESRVKGEQWRETFARRNREGLGHTTYPRLGYRLDGKRLVPDADTRHLPVEAYRRFVGGDGGPQLAAWLNSLGVAQPRSGGPWTPKTLRRFLDSGFAAGMLRVGDTYFPGAQEALVGARLWQRYLRERDRRRGVPARLVAPVHPLSGLVRCPGCGRAMRVKRLKARAGNRDRPGSPRRTMIVCESFGCQDRGYVSADRAVAAVLEWLRPHAEDIDISTATQTADRAAKQVARADRRALERERVKVEQRLARLTVDLASGLVLPAEYQAARDLLAGSRRDLLAALDAADRTVERPSPSPQRVRRLLEAWDGMTDVGRNRALRDLVARVDLVRQVEGRAVVRPLGVWEVVPVRDT